MLEPEESSMKSWKSLVGTLAATLLLVACAEDDPGGTADTGPEQDSGWDADVDPPEDMGSDTEDMGNDARDGGEDMGEDMGNEDLTTIRGVRSTEAVANLEPGEQTSERYTLTDVVISSTQPANESAFFGLYIQDASGEAQKSGLFVQANIQGAIPPLQRGDVLSISGQIENNDGELQIPGPSLGEVTQEGQAPAPEVVEASALEGDEYEGVLVSVEGQTVATWDPSSNDGTADFESGLTIGSYLYDFSADYPDVSSGDDFSSVTGILGVVDGDRRLFPREEGDLVTNSAGSGGGG